MVLTTHNLCWSKFSHVSFDTYVDGGQALACNLTAAGRCINLLHIEGVEPSRNGGGQESFDVGEAADCGAMVDSPVVNRSRQREAWERGTIERVKGKERGICAASLSSWQISSHQKPKASRCTYTFRCRSKHSKGSPTERDMWIAAIREAMENARARKGPSLSHLVSLSTTSSSLPPFLSFFQLTSFRISLTLAMVS